MKNALRLLIVIFAFSLMGTGPAKACPPIPGIKEVCDLVTGNSFLDAVVSRVRIYVETMLYELKLESEKKYHQTVSVLEMKGRRASAHREDERDLKPAIAGQRCVLQSAMVVGLQGKVDTTPITQPPSLTDSTAASTATTTAAARPKLPPARNTAGEPVPVGPALETVDTSKYDYETFRRGLVVAQEKVLSDRRQNMPKSSADKWADVKTQYNKHLAYYGPDQPEMFRDADLQAGTILNYDTFPSAVNKPVGEGLPTAGMQDAARDFCKNLTDATILDPNRGDALKNDTARQGHAVERAGWDARLSLASTVCNDAVARRAPKTVSNTQGLVKIAQEWRTKACNATAITDKSNLRCDDGYKFSEFEMMKNLYSQLLPSLQGASLLGAGDALYNLLAVDQLAVTLNYRIYELQQQMNLVKAAQLAQMVDNTRTSPGASAPK